MRIFMQDEWVYVPVGKDRFLCVGSKGEVEKATPFQFSRMIYESMATAEYHAIKDSHAHTVH